jgi:hypothetical protein
MWPIAKSMQQVKHIAENIFNVKMTEILLVFDFDRTLIGDINYVTDGKVIKQQLCDSDAPKSLYEMKISGADIIILTARNKNLVGITEETVRTLLPQQILSKHKTYETNDWYFANGICSCGSASKGNVLIELLPYLSKSYKCLILVDDLASNLNNYIKLLSERTNNSFIAILYKYSPDEINSGELKSIKVRENRKTQILSCGGSPLEINRPLSI